MSLHEEIYVSKEVLNYWWWPNGGTILSSNDTMRCYEIWSHASDLCTNAKSDLDRSDAISALKRSLNHRLKLIDKLYNLSANKKKFAGSPKGELDLLSLLGLIRPMFLKKLVDIRNSIEHKDRKPPSKKMCAEMIDILWYFLRSTDEHVSMKTGYYEIADHSGESMAYVEVNWKKCQIKISGSLASKFVYDTSDLYSPHISTKTSVFKLIRSRPRTLPIRTTNNDCEKVEVEGVFVLTPEDTVDIYKKLFDFYSCRFPNRNR